MGYIGIMETKWKPRCKGDYIRLQESRVTDFSILSSGEVTNLKRLSLWGFVQAQRRIYDLRFSV